MRGFPFLRNSVGHRLVLGMAVMLLPLAVGFAGSYRSSLDMLRALEQVVATEVDELLPVVELHKTMLRAAMPPNDYIILGVAEEREQFARLSGLVDEQFAALHSGGIFGEDEEQRVLGEAHDEWRRAKELGARILVIPEPAGKELAGRLMKQYDDSIAVAAGHLEKLQLLVQREAEEHRRTARAVKARETAFLLGIAATALVVAGLVGALLARSIIGPVHELRNAVQRFSQGDYSFRTPAVWRDEFGELARTLNSMAEGLESDPLTGVYNRRELQRRLGSEIDRSRRFTHVFSLLMLDIDDFKKVNDAHGHPFGDEVLRKTAAVLLRDLRGADMLARYGGEEFAILLPETASELAASVADRLRDAVATQSLATADGVEVRVTVSVGTASFPDDAESQEGLVSAADRALYAAKASGRNRVCTAGTAAVPPVA